MWVEGCEAKSILAPGGTTHPKASAADLLCVIDAKLTSPREAAAYQLDLVLWGLFLLVLYGLLCSIARVIVA